MRHEWVDDFLGSYTHKHLPIAVTPDGEQFVRGEGRFHGPDHEEIQFRTILYANSEKCIEVCMKKTEEIYNRLKWKEEY